MGGGGLLAQKYQPKYLRNNDEVFKNLTERTTENGWTVRRRDNFQKGSQNKSKYLLQRLCPNSLRLVASSSPNSI